MKAAAKVPSACPRRFRLQSALLRAMCGGIVAASLVSLAEAKAGYAQDSTGPGDHDSSPFVLHQKVEEVLLYCSVLDHQGSPVVDLDRSAFTVLEDKAPVRITHFDHKDVPVSLSLVLDDSSSMKEKRAAVQIAAADLIRASNPLDETSLTNFADTTYLDLDFTGEFAKLQAALAQSKTVSGGTALFDTIISTANHLSRDAHHSKQVIVVVTDGRDNASEADLSAAIRRVQTANGPMIYTIGLLYDVPGAEARRARHDLLALSDETGGVAFFPSSVNEVDRIANQVAKDIRNQYTVAYRPPATSGAAGYRTITVAAASSSHGKLTVRSRKGYLRIRN